MERVKLAERGGPQPRDQGILLFQAIEPLVDWRQWDAKSMVLASERARPKPELDPSPAHQVDLSHRDRQVDRIAER
jgi:hypothetical protein